MLANKQKCSCFKSIRILTLLRVPLWIIKIGLVRFQYVTLRAGLEIMMRWAFALLFFLWNVKVGMRVLIFLNVSMSLRSLAYILWCSHWKWKNGIIYIYILYI